MHTCVLVRTPRSVQRTVTRKHSSGFSVCPLVHANSILAFSPLNKAPSSGLNGVGGATVGADVGVSVGVGDGCTRVTVGVGVQVGAGVGVSVGVTVGVKVGVRLGVGVVVGVLVGMGVFVAVGVDVKVGTSTRTRIGTSLATAWTVPIANGGRKPSRRCCSQGITRNKNAIATTKPAPISSGRSQSCRRGSPQLGHTSKARLLTVPQCRQRMLRGCRWGLPQWGQTSCPVWTSVRQRLHFFTGLPRRR